VAVRASGAPRATRQRAAVTALLERTDGFRSAQELHGQLRRAGDGIGLTTVYRALELLAEAGEVDVLRNDTGEALYRRCRTSDHHHHLVCRECGLAVDVDGPPDVEGWARQTAEAHGFSEERHSVEIYGLCRDCSARR
jgi:Fur family ferric uptake transcriptional regulator